MPEPRLCCATLEAVRATAFYFADPDGHSMEVFTKVPLP